MNSIIVPLVALEIKYLWIEQHYIYLVDKDYNTWKANTLCLHKHALDMYI